MDNFQNINPSNQPQNPTVPMPTLTPQENPLPKTDESIPPVENKIPTDGFQNTGGEVKKPFNFKIILIAVLVLVLIGASYLLFGYFKNKKQASEVKEVVYWGLWEDSGIIDPLIKEYETKNPNVKIKYVRQSHQDYRDRLTSAIGKGTAPDIFRFHNSWTAMLKKDLDYLPASVMSAAEFAQTYYPVATSDLTSGTGIVGIPLEYDSIALFVNDDIFTTAGKTAPKTWDELRKTARELTVKDEDGTIIQSGVALGRVENVDHWQEILALMMLQNGVNLTKPTGKLAADALSFFTAFSSVDGVWDKTMPKSTTAFAAGKLAMYFGPSWRVFEVLQQNPKLKVRAIALPQLPKSDASDEGISYASYWAEGVWAKSKNKKEAWDFLKFLSGKESLQKLYQNASKVRLFGEPYPRVDMAGLLSSDPIVGTIIATAPNAQSWYLYSRTWDGPTGINTLLSKYFEDAISSVNNGTPAEETLETVSSGVSQVLTQYGLMSQ